jgi:hypothetical protein
MDYCFNYFSWQGYPCFTFVEQPRFFLNGFNAGIGIPIFITGIFFGTKYLDYKKKVKGRIIPGLPI